MERTDLVEGQPPVEEGSVRTLEQLLEPLARHYLQDEVEEIAVCDAHKVFHKLRRPTRTGSWWRPAHDARLTRSYLLSVMHFTANTYGMSFDPEGVPAVYAILPGGHRYTSVAGKGVRYEGRRPHPEGGVGMAIRQAPKEGAKHSLEDWSLKKGAKLGAQEKVLRALRPPPKDAHRAILEAAAKGKPLLFSGPTSSGKTTLLNMLLGEIDESLRVVTVEDTPELIVHNPNRLRLIVEKDPPPKDAPADGSLDGRRIIDLVTRLTPDVVLVGEIASGNAAMALEVLAAGEANFWTSVHAPDPEGAFLSWAKRVEHTRPGVKQESVIEELRKTFTVIQTQKDGGRRTISHVVTPEHWNKKEEGNGLQH